MNNKIFRAVVALTNTLTTNILNPPTASGGVNGGSSAQYILINHIRFVNRTGSIVTISLWLGATGANMAGTEVIGQQVSIPANGVYDYYGLLRIDSSTFLVGGASASSAVTATFEGEIGVSG